MQAVKEIPKYQLEVTVDKDVINDMDYVGGIDETGKNYFLSGW